jgi:DNA-binding transcriptional LysR family regulator
MKDINELFIFAQVVEHKGFTGAARALGVARSSICRRVSNLEGRLGVRLVQRSTRHFAVTELGMELHGHCVKMIAEARAAYDRAACARSRPSGLIRLSCPSILTQLLVGPLIPLFKEMNPEVCIAIEGTDRKVAIEENFDLSIRIRQLPGEDSGMIMRSLGIFQLVLVASPRFLERHGRPGCLADIMRMPTISADSLQGPHVWKLIDGNRRETQLRHEPYLATDDMIFAHQSAVQGQGIAQLPLPACVSDIRGGALEIVLPDFQSPLYQVQIIFPSRRGMLPAVRSFIDFLSAQCVSEEVKWQEKRPPGQWHREGSRFWADRSKREIQVA